MQDLTCVFEGIDNKGAIFISAIHTAKNTPLLKSKFKETKNIISKLSCRSPEEPMLTL